jgi:glucose-6-phosphate isomerase
MKTTRFLFKAGDYAEAVASSLARIGEDQVARRILKRDHTVWKDDPAGIAGRLGWLDSPGLMSGEIPRIARFTRDLRADGYTDALLLGMGGSSLAPDLFRKVFGVGEGCIDLRVLDSTDPAALLEHAERLDPARTLYLVSTKSGTTAETISFFKYFYNLTLEKIGAKETGRHFAAITDPGSALESIASNLGFRDLFLNDPDIGGRYSALSFFGLVPASLLGIDIGRLLDRARTMADACGSFTGMAGGDRDTGTVLGAAMGTLHNLGVDKLTLITSPGIRPLGAWLEQLLAESTGKQGKGILPVDGEIPGRPDVYGRDRLFVHLSQTGEKTYDSQVHALEQAGHPVIRIVLNDLYDIGAEFFRWEWATAVAGHQMGINPFDQPDVESAKARTREMLGEYKARGRFPEPAPASSEKGIETYTDSPGTSLGDSLGSFLDNAGPGSYVALQAYVNPASETVTALGELRDRIRDSLRVAATVGFGPRFLHSTGQLHKGDGGKGLFIQITCTDTADVPIPDEAGKDGSTVTFGTLKAAEALGDFQALTDRGRRVIRFNITGDVAEGIHTLRKTLG